MRPLEIYSSLRLSAPIRTALDTALGCKEGLCHAGHECSRSHSAESSKGALLLAGPWSGIPDSEIAPTWQLLRSDSLSQR
ncbi:hypothetical protein Y1Q_0004834 [Alligator mississippiensis]|uniref:Uncharacterized protein n=1 Tax=Alligator mississippiensis TaxID=8496 RepID=A0A151NQR8_ALLMI|nr:hypothetical protein Y1Q_0004834 [Alligator mississippiensis]